MYLCSIISELDWNRKIKMFADFSSSTSFSSSRHGQASLCLQNAHTFSVLSLTLPLNTRRRRHYVSRKITKHKPNDTNYTSQKNRVLYITIVKPQISHTNFCLKSTEKLQVASTSIPVFPKGAFLVLFSVYYTRLT